MNKRFFKLENELSIKTILEFLNISEKIFYKYNSKKININDFKIYQFSSLSNSSDDSLIFINKRNYYNLKDIKGVCITKVPLQEYNFKNNIVIPSTNPKFDVKLTKFYQIFIKTGQNIQILYAKSKKIVPE